MTQQDRIDYMQITLGVAGVVVDAFTTEFICELNDLLSKKGGNVKVREIIKLRTYIASKYGMSGFEQPALISDNPDYE